MTKKQRRLVIGDIHGRFQALKQVLQLSKFDYDNDKLILLGDICDGGYNTYEVVEELLKIKNIIFVLGNHDQWFINYMQTGWRQPIWTEQGGNATINSYREKIRITHKEFFESAIPYHVEDNICFVHGGFDPKVPIENQETEILMWDRQLIEYAKNAGEIKQFDRVFIGHTTTQHYGFMQPVKYGKLIMMDCGAGNDGRLAIMDIDTEEHWLSDIQPGVI